MPSSSCRWRRTSGGVLRMSHRCSSDSSFVPTRCEILAGLQRGASLEVHVLSGLVSQYNTCSLNNVAGS